MTNKETLIKANERVMAGDHEGFLAFCTEDTTWDFVGDQILIGKDAVRKYMLQTYVEPPRFDIESLISDEDYVTAIGKISLKGEGGKMIDYEYCDNWHFRDGKMFELKAFVIDITKKNG